MKKISAPILEISNLIKKEKKNNINGLSLVLPAGDKTAVLYKPENEGSIELLCDILSGSKKSSKGKIFFKSEDVTGDKNVFGVVKKNIPSVKNRILTDYASAPIVKKGLDKRLAAVLVQKELKEFELDEYVQSAVSKLDDNLQKRAAVFYAYMCSHELIVINEPFSGLDDLKKAQEFSLFEKITAKHHTSLLVFTTSADTAIRLADTVMVVNDETASLGIIAADKRRPERTKEKLLELLGTAKL